jgi:hypothetical protein
LQHEQPFESIQQSGYEPTVSSGKVLSRSETKKQIVVAVKRMAMRVRGQLGLLVLTASKLPSEQTLDRTSETTDIISFNNLHLSRSFESLYDLRKRFPIFPFKMDPSSASPDTGPPEQIVDLGDDRLQPTCEPSPSL